MTRPEPTETIPEFSIAHGAPFCRFQERVGLIRPASLQPGRRALLFALIGWLPLMVLTLLAGTFAAPHDPRAFLFDYTVHARLLLAIPLFIFLEVIARARLSQLVHQFVRGGLVAAEQVGSLKAIIRRALARRNSGWCEAVIVFLAIAASIGVVRTNLGWRSPSWLGSLTDGTIDLSAAGWWYLVVSSPLFFFLLFRWLWRFGLWVGMLAQIARLDLRLVATHPDRAGGLMFIGQYPIAFQAFAFAVSSVAASSIARDLVFSETTVQDVRGMMIAWVVVIVLLFALPLTVFGRPLKAAKRRALLDYSAFASRHNLAFEQRWIRNPDDDADPLGAPEISSLADLNAGYEAVRTMRTAPISKQAILPVVVAALVPMVAAAATQVPLRDLLNMLKILVI